MDAIRQFIVEVQLRRKLEAPLGHRRGANLEVNMYRSARIPARVHSDKPSLTARVGDLIATQKLLADGVEIRILHIRIDAQRIAMPDVHLGARQRLTVSGVEARDQQLSEPVAYRDSLARRSDQSECRSDASAHRQNMALRFVQVGPHMRVQVCLQQPAWGSDCRSSARPHQWRQEMPRLHGGKGEAPQTCLHPSLRSSSLSSVPAN